MMLLVGVLLVWSGTALAGGPWAGTWETRWRGGGARLELEQEGNRVTGRYPLYDGRIEATADGRRLDGRWVEGAESGNFSFVLGEDGRSFAGRYDTGEWWTGKRAGPRQLPAMNLSSPREALRSFVLASNLVRGGVPDALGAATEAIDFGPDAAPSHGEKLERATALFDLMDLTTFRIWSAPSEADTPTVTIRLEQTGTNAALPLTLVRDARGAWRIRMPPPEEMAAARRALLAQSGGQPPAADAFRRLQSPRDAMRAFLEGMADWNGAGRALALSTLDLSHVPESLRDLNGALAAEYLRRVLDQIGLVGLQSIPNSGANRDAYVHFAHPAGRVVIAPVGEGAATRWQFDARTVADIDRVYLAIEDLPPPIAMLPGLVPASEFFALRAFVRTHAPALLGRLGRIEYWQIIGATLTVLVVAVAGGLLAFAILKGLRRFLGRRAVPRPRLFAWSVGVVSAVLIASRIAPALGIPEQIRQYSHPVVGIILSVSAAMLGWLVLGLAGHLLTARADRTTTTADDILLTLLLAAARVAVVVAAALGVAYFLSIPTQGILAGLGIGGLAVAFASRETISNLFGAGILVGDRPFRRGDWIIAGDVEGSVEHVGIRSTRVRTAQDSVMVVPNGKLADSIINNLGTRRHRLIRARIMVTQGGTPERLDAFAASIRHRIARDESFLSGRTEVGVVGISEQGVEIDLTTYLNVRTLSAERAAKHELMLDIVRLATREGLVLGPGMGTSLEQEAATA